VSAGRENGPQRRYNNGNSLAKQAHGAKKSPRETQAHEKSEFFRSL
jgi:hypothetical protein